MRCFVSRYILWQDKATDNHYKTVNRVQRRVKKVYCWSPGWNIKKTINVHLIKQAIMLKAAIVNRYVKFYNAVEELMERLTDCPENWCIKKIKTLIWLITKTNSDNFEINLIWKWRKLWKKNLCPIKNLIRYIWPSHWHSLEHKKPHKHSPTCTRSHMHTRTLAHVQTQKVLLKKNFFE